MDAAEAHAPYERKETAIIVNPAAHNLPRPKRRSRIDEWLREQGWAVEWLETSRPGEATAMAADAARRRVPLVMTLGGDGTLNEAANGLAGSGTALGMIPGGTSNLWAREVGLDKKPPEAVQLIVEGERRQIDLGRAGDRYFVLFAGFGLDAAVTQHVSLKVKERVGAAAYALSALNQAVRWRPAPTTVRVDGREQHVDVLMALIANTRLYAGITQITPLAVADDGWLDICLYTGRSKIDMIQHVTTTLLQRHSKSKKVIYRQARRIEFEWSRPLPVQVDGDPLDCCPSEVVVEPLCLWVAVPAGLATPLLTRAASRPREAQLSLARRSAD